MRFFLLLLSFLALPLEAASQLNTKLTAQWKRFDEARALGLSRAKTGRLPVTREEWERTVSISPGFTTEELKELRERQEKRALTVKLQNERSSTLDLKRLRTLGKDVVGNFCAELPKGGMLHLHPWGTLSAPGLELVLQQANPMLRPSRLYDALKDPKGTAYLYPDELSFIKGLAKSHGEAVPYAKLSAEEKARFRELFFLTRGEHDFPRFQSVFFLIREAFFLEASGDATQIMYDDFFARARAQKVSYVELSDLLIPLNKATVDSRERVSELAKRQHGITATWLAAFMRIKTPKELGEDAAQLLSLAPSQSLLGINLVADESDTPVFERGQTLYLPLLKASLEGKTKLRRGVHAGELGDPRNVRDALILGAERIGHGVGMSEDPVVIEYASLYQTPVEVNLTSNLRLKAVKALQDHPYLKYLRLGMRVSLSTDDEGILGSDINHECELAVNETDLNYLELKSMISNSLDTAFASPVVMGPIKGQLKMDLAAFEKSWTAKIRAGKG